MSEQEPRKIDKVELASLLNRDWELDGRGEDEIYFKSKLPDGYMARMKMCNFRDCADPTNGSVLLSADSARKNMSLSLALKSLRELTTKAAQFTLRLRH